MSDARQGRLHDRIALVTGASRGIGRSAARIFAREGAHVILVARTTGGLEEVDDEVTALGGTATLVPLDLKDFDAIDQLGASIYERWGKLDIALGNAGVLGDLAPLPHVDPKSWQEVLDVNVTANWRLIRSLDPLLRLSDAGRFVFVTSGAAVKFNAYWGPYSVSKAALDALAKTYAAEMQNTSVRINLFSPGATRTGMRADAMPGEDPETLPHPDEVAEALLDLVAPECTRNGEIISLRK